MSVTLAVRNGRPAVELVDHKGEVYGYHYDVLANTPRLFSVKLTKLDEQDGGTVYVASLGERWFSCDCPHWRFRARKTGEFCKHLSAASSLRPLLAALGQAVQTAVREARP